jgi:flagellar basal body-associated protein FliL
MYIHNTGWMVIAIILVIMLLGGIAALMIWLITKANKYKGSKMK